MVDIGEVYKMFLTSYLINKASVHAVAYCQAGHCPLSCGCIVFCTCLQAKGFLYKNNTILTTSIGIYKTKTLLSLWVEMHASTLG